MLAKVLTGAAVGLDGAFVEVEVDIASGRHSLWRPGDQRAL
jgi:hypothetical protein